MPDLNTNQDDTEFEEGEHLNEFELSAEEKAELAALNAQNGNSDTVSEIGDGGEENNGKPSESNLFDDIEVDEEELKKLNAEQGENNNDDNAGNNNLEHNAGDGGNGNAAIGTDTGAGDLGEGNNNQDIEPPKDYSEDLEELDQQRQEANGKVQDTLDQLKELSTKFDDGDVGQGAYDFQRLTLERQLKKNESDAEKLASSHEALQDKAAQDSQEYVQKQQHQWMGSLQNFVALPENELIKNNRNVADRFDQILGALNNSGMLDGLTHAQVLSTVRANLAIQIPALNDAVKATPANNNETKPAKPTHDKAKIPLSLANQQTLEIPDNTDPFAYIRKLSGIEYEKAFGELSEDQQNQFYS